MELRNEGRLVLFRSIDLLMHGDPLGRTMYILLVAEDDGRNRLIDSSLLDD